MLASCFIFMSHESPQQQQLSGVAFFCSVWEGVWAPCAVNAVRIKPKTRIRVVFLRDFIVVLLYRKISALHAGKHTDTPTKYKQRQADRSLNQENTTPKVGRSTIMKERNSRWVFRLTRSEERR